MQALEIEPFDPSRAARAWSAFEAQWIASVDADPASGWSVKWDSSVFDPGQCDNAHADRLSHPLIHACRFGSPEAVAWVCEQKGIEPKVEFERVSDCWCFVRAGATGMAGAFDPLWRLAKRLGWGEDLLGEALAGWLSGAADAPPARIEATARACSVALLEMEREVPGFKLPLAPTGPFRTGLERAVHGGFMANQAKPDHALRALLAAAPGRFWVHPTDVEDAFDEDELHPLDPRGFAEDGLVAAVRSPSCFEMMLEAGFEPPSLERGLAVLDHCDGRDSPAGQALQAFWARREASQIEAGLGAAPAKAGARL